MSQPHHSYPWLRRRVWWNFSFPMGSYDGAETCELVGCYLLSQLKEDQIIDGHNKTILKKESQPPQDQAEKACNCRNKNECPLEGACLTKEIIYQATVVSDNSTETYIGATSTEFKTRWRNHQVSFKSEKRKNDTELSKHLWKLKSERKNFAMKWKILAKAKAYTNITKRCNLCLTEKYFIITKPHLATLNKRNELISTCRHNL